MYDAVNAHMTSDRFEICPCGSDTVFYYLFLLLLLLCLWGFFGFFGGGGVCFFVMYIYIL